MRNKYAVVSDPNSFVTDPGSRYHIIYDPVVKSDGTIVLEESGQDDIQEYIDSFRDQTDMSFILQRMALGDLSVLSQKTPMYGDFTNMPKTYAEALQLVLDSEKKFMQLPLEVRNLFDNDYRKWFATSGSDEWMQKMAPVLSELGEVKPGADGNDDEVKSDES